jgi:hypothetical protein
LQHYKGVMRLIIKEIRSKTNPQRSFSGMRILFTFLVSILLFTGCTTHELNGGNDSQILEIQISQSREHGSINPDILERLTDKKSYDIFIQAIQSASQIKGILNTSTPDFDFNIKYENNESHGYHFWVSGEQGMFMDLRQGTGIGYSLTKQSTKEIKELIQFEERGVIEEKQEGDFVLKIISEKSQYRNDEEVKIHAMLMYKGDKAEETIYHAASPFLFTVTENDRGITIPSIMPVPLISTILKKGEWLKKTYGKSGGYGENDPNADFIKEFLKGKGFPEGNYTIEVKADFFTKNDDDQEKEYDFSTSIKVKVK